MVSWAMDTSESKHCVKPLVLTPFMLPSFDVPPITPVTLEAGVKYDDGKLRYDLIPPEALQGLALVYTIGAKKYEDRNWEKGIGYSRIYGALMRHTQAFVLGEDMDPDGQHHLDSVSWCAFALRTYEARGMGAAWDDLRHGRRRT